MRQRNRIQSSAARLQFGVPLLLGRLIGLGIVGGAPLLVLAGVISYLVVGVPLLLGWLLGLSWVVAGVRALIGGSEYQT